MKDTEVCTFFVELDLKRPFPARGTDLSTWEVNSGVSSIFILAHVSVTICHVLTII